AGPGGPTGRTSRVKKKSSKDNAVQAVQPVLHLNSINTKKNHRKQITRCRVAPATAEQSPKDNEMEEYRMTTMDNIHTPSRAPLDASLMAAIKTKLAQLPQTPHTIESFSIRWTEPTPPEDIHPDDWINPLPARPRR